MCSSATTAPSPGPSTSHTRGGSTAEANAPPPGGLDVLLQNPSSVCLHLQVRCHKFFQDPGRGQCSPAPTPGVSEGQLSAPDSATVPPPPTSPPATGDPRNPTVSLHQHGLKPRTGVTRSLTETGGLCLAQREGGTCTAGFIQSPSFWDVVKQEDPATCSDPSAYICLSDGKW